MLLPSPAEQPGGHPEYAMTNAFCGVRGLCLWRIYFHFWRVGAVMQRAYAGWRQSSHNHVAHNDSFVYCSIGVLFCNARLCVIGHLFVEVVWLQLVLHLLQTALVFVCIFFLFFFLFLILFSFTVFLLWGSGWLESSHFLMDKCINESHN